MPKGRKISRYSLVPSVFIDSKIEKTKCTFLNKLSQKKILLKIKGPSSTKVALNYPRVGTYKGAIKISGDLFF